MGTKGPLRPRPIPKSRLKLKENKMKLIIDGKIKKNGGYEDYYDDVKLEIKLEDSNVIISNYDIGISIELSDLKKIAKFFENES